MSLRDDDPERRQGLWAGMQTGFDLPPWLWLVIAAAVGWFGSPWWAVLPGLMAVAALLRRSRP